MSITTNIGLFKHDNPATNTDEFNVDKALNQNWDKIDEAIGKDRERITTLETDNTTNKQDITEIKAKDVEQDNRLENIETKNTEQDTNIQKNTDDITKLNNLIGDINTILDDINGSEV